MLTEAERDQTSRHEAAHAVAFLRAGHRVKEVRCDDITETELGRVLLDLTDFEPGWGYLLGVMAGPLANGRDLPRWDELTLRSTGDDFQIAFQTRLLKLTERDYEAACEEAKDALTNSDAAAAVTLLGRALARVRVISGAEVEELLSDYMPRLRPERTPDAA